MFMGPYDEGGDWNDKGIKGIYRFLNKIWRLINAPLKDGDDSKTVQLMHQTIKIVTENLHDMKFNTSISRIMEFVNYLTQANYVNLEIKNNLASLIAPFAPHLAEEIWEILGHKNSIFDSDWPGYDSSKLESNEITIIIQVNGKLRGNLLTEKGLQEQDILQQCKSMSNVKKYLENGEVIKEIYIPNKLVNFVIKNR